MGAGHRSHTVDNYFALRYQASGHLAAPETEAQHGTVRPNMATKNNQKYNRNKALP